MALYAFDGTWNQQKDNDTAYANTNVARFFDAYHARSGTDDVYEQGIGTKLGAIGHAIGGAFGAGELDRLEGAYNRLCENWVRKNDKIIDLVGFSRGAATCLDFCNLITRRGISDPVTHDKRSDTPRFRFVGLFDVVGAFGAGAVLFDLPVFNLGHHLSIPREQIDYCFHAMALDEVRTSFNVIRVGGAHEVWFRGVHGDVGGGDANRGLNDITLRWMMLKAKAAGLPFTAEDIAALHPDASCPPQLHDLPPIWRPMGAADLRHYTVQTMNKCRPLASGGVIEDPATEVIAQRVGASGVRADAQAGGVT
ncbi:MAG TPA: DUF2235 domain-containing protein [Vicinamibacterales bacterium]|jgi:hypothetical protein